MGVSTNGQICYGILFEEDTEFPWEGHDGDIEDWWLTKVLGFKHSFEIYTEEGEYIGGKEPDKSVIDKYYFEKKKFEDSHPKVPVTLVNVCSCENPQYILAIPSTVKTARRGYPERFQPSLLTAHLTIEQIDALTEFCETHKIEYEGEPGWYLSSEWC